MPKHERVRRMNIIELTLLGLLLLNMTWVYYVAIVGLYRARDTLGMPAKVMTYMGALIGVPLDILLNLVASVLLCDLPREVTLSQRLSRLNNTGGWRGDVARWVCAELLDPFDPRGAHCK